MWKKKRGIIKDISERDGGDKNIKSNLLNQESNYLYAQFLSCAHSNEIQKWKKIVILRVKILPRLLLSVFIGMPFPFFYAIPNTFDIGFEEKMGGMCGERERESEEEKEEALKNNISDLLWMMGGLSGNAFEKEQVTLLF